MAVHTKERRGYSAGKWALDLDGINAGWLWSAEGGHPTSDVVVEKLGPDHLSKKHIAGVKYEDITIQCGTGMSKQFYQWIQNSFEHRYSRKDGAIIVADYDYREQSRLNFFKALITEVGFPALDAASKDAAKMNIKLAPEYTRQVLRKDREIRGENKQELQKKWLPSNFRLHIDGLDEACSRVNKVEAIVVKQKVVENPIGQLRDYEREPVMLEVPNLVITFPESHADGFYKWVRSFIVDGKNGDDQEKTGTLEYLTPDLQTVLFTLEFRHLGIFKLTPEKVESGSENIRRLKAEMYCEDIKFTYGKSVWA